MTEIDTYQVFPPYPHVYNNSMGRMKLLYTSQCSISTWAYKFDRDQVLFGLSHILSLVVFLTILRVFLK